MPRKEGVYQSFGSVSEFWNATMTVWEAYNREFGNKGSVGSIL